MIEYGTRLLGVSRPAPEDLQLEVGKVYQVNMKASTGIIDPEGVAEFLMSKLNEAYPELRVVWMQVSPETINFQFTVVSAESLGFTPRPERLFVAGLLVWLPAILTLLGISLAAVSVWQIMTEIPWYVWLLLGAGVFLLFFGPAITTFITRRVPEKYVVVR